MDNIQPQRRPGGRSTRIREAVHRAVEELIAERGEEHLTIADIAERSGVHHATIYRRWGTTEAIILDVAAARLQDESPIPDTGSLRGDLIAYATGAAASIEGADGLSFLRAVITSSATANGPEGRVPLLHRGAAIQIMLNRARDRGEPELHFTDVLDGILSPLYMRVLFGIGGITTQYLTSLVDRTLRLAAPPLSRS